MLPSNALWPDPYLTLAMSETFFYQWTESWCKVALIPLMEDYLNPKVFFLEGLKIMIIGYKYFTTYKKYSLIDLKEVLTVKVFFQVHHLKMGLMKLM